MLWFVYFIWLTEHMKFVCFSKISKIHWKPFLFDILFQVWWIGRHRDGSSASSRRHAVFEVVEEVGVWQHRTEHGSSVVHVDAEEEELLFARQTKNREGPFSVVPLFVNDNRIRVNISSYGILCSMDQSRGWYIKSYTSIRVNISSYGMHRSMDQSRGWYS